MENDIKTWRSDYNNLDVEHEEWGRKGDTLEKIQDGFDKVFSEFIDKIVNG